jgi:hypothetical protein
LTIKEGGRLLILKSNALCCFQMKVDAPGGTGNIHRQKESTTAAPSMSNSILPRLTFTISTTYQDKTMRSDKGIKRFLELP